MRHWFAPIILVMVFANPAFSQDFDPRKIYKKASNAVVLIAAFERGQKSSSKGTGSIINEDGFVLTNAHVIFNDEKNKPFDSIRIFLKPDRVTGDLKKDTSRKFKATLVHFSNPMDLAILKIQDLQLSNPVPLLEFSDLKETFIGDPVLAIGHPEQGGLWTLTTGTISSLIENFEDIPGKDVFQTETSINRGNSGGPLIDRSGHIVGINSMIARQGKGGIAITDINFSIKSTVAMKWMRSVGYSHSYAIPKSKKTSQKTQNHTYKSGIVPVPTQPSESMEIKPEPKQEPQKEPEILTEVRPYEEKDLFDQVEDEMEDMMGDMKGRIQSR